MKVFLKYAFDKTIDFLKYFIDGCVKLFTITIKPIIICVIVYIVISFGYKFFFEYEHKNRIFSFVSEHNGQIVFLDNKNSELLLFDENWQLYKTVSLAKEANLSPDDYDFLLNLNFYADDETELQGVKKWSSKNISGTNYSVDLTTRFYNNKLLYIATIKPYDTDIRYRNTNSIAIDFLDNNGFVLESISCTNWTRIVNSNGEPQYMKCTGNIPITYRNYSELKEWSLKWTTPF